MKAVGTVLVKAFLWGIGLFCLMGLTPPPPEKAIKTIPYQGDGFSFNYPADWVTFDRIWENKPYQHDPYLDADELWGAADLSTKTPWEKYTTSVRVLKKKYEFAGSFRDEFERVYAKMPSPVEWKFEREITVNGRTALEKGYKRPHGEPWYEICDIWIDTAPCIFIISYRAIPSQYRKGFMAFQLLYKSFSIDGDSREDGVEQTDIHGPSLDEIPDGKDVSVGGAPPEFTFRTLWKKALRNAQLWSPKAFLVYAAGEFLNDKGVPSSWEMVFSKPEDDSECLRLTIDPWGKISERSVCDRGSCSGLVHISSAFQSVKPVVATIADSDAVSREAARLCKERFWVTNPFDPCVVLTWNNAHRRPAWVYRFRPRKGEAFCEVWMDAVSLKPLETGESP